MKKNYQLSDDDPQQKFFELPSEKEHIFQVVDVKENTENDSNIVRVKLEVVGGNEKGRTLLHRLNLDEETKGFFAVRLFLKAIGEPHKGKINLDTDRWFGHGLTATVIHNGKYANIDVYNFGEINENSMVEVPSPTITENKQAWDADESDVITEAEKRTAFGIETQIQECTNITGLDNVISWAVEDFKKLPGILKTDLKALVAEKRKEFNK